MSKTSFSEGIFLATNSKFTLPVKNSSRVDRVHASEKHKIKRYLEGSLEDIEARQAADTKAFHPVKILEKSNLAKNSKINTIRNSSGMPHSPIGSLRTKTFENKDLQQVLADKRKRNQRVVQHLEFLRAHCLPPISQQQCMKINEN